jgi:hypothetical protein
VTVTAIGLKSIITRPLAGERLDKGAIVVLGAAYAGEGHVAQVEVSVDDGATWQAAEFIGPDEPFAWRQWQYVWHANQAGEYTIKSRATDSQGRQQPETARWNFLGYGNNGIDEHAVRVIVAETAVFVTRNVRPPSLSEPLYRCGLRLIMRRMAYSMTAHHPDCSPDGKKRRCPDPVSGSAVCPPRRCRHGWSRR